MMVDTLLSSKSACVGLLCCALAHLGLLQPLVGTARPSPHWQWDLWPALTFRPPPAPAALTLAAGAPAWGCGDNTAALQWLGGPHLRRGRPSLCDPGGLWPGPAGCPGFPGGAVSGDR